MEQQEKTQPQNSPVQQPPNPSAIQQKKSSANIIIILLLLIIILLLGVIGYFAFMKNTPNQISVTPTPVVTHAVEAPTPSPLPTQAINIDENVKAAIESKNYTALEGYMTPSVNVLLHASECCGIQTKTQAIAQLDYLNKSQTPWNWDQSSNLIKQIKLANPTTFGKGTVGIANNEYTVSYEVTSDKITAIYLSVSYKLLIP